MNRPAGLMPASTHPPLHVFALSLAAARVGVGVLCQFLCRNLSASSSRAARQSLSLTISGQHGSVASGGVDLRQGDG